MLSKWLLIVNCAWGQCWVAVSMVFCCLGVKLVGPRATTELKFGLLIVFLFRPYLPQPFCRYQLVIWTFHRYCQLSYIRYSGQIQCFIDWVYLVLSIIHRVDCRYQKTISLPPPISLLPYLSLSPLLSIYLFISLSPSLSPSYFLSHIINAHFSLLVGILYQTNSSP